MNKLSVEGIDAEVKENDPRPPLRKTVDAVKSVALPVVGAAAAGIASLGRKQTNVVREIE